MNGTLEKENQIENSVVQLNNILLQIDRQKKYYGTDLSVLDGAISDLTHDIERDEHIDLYKGYLYTMRLKQLCYARRQLKEQHEQIKLLEKTLNVSNTIDSMGRAMLKVDKEMPKKRKTRVNDLLEPGKIELKNGWVV